MTDGEPARRPITMPIIDAEGAADDLEPGEPLIEIPLSLVEADRIREAARAGYGGDLTEFYETALATIDVAEEYRHLAKDCESKTEFRRAGFRQMLLDHADDVDTDAASTATERFRVDEPLE